MKDTSIVSREIVRVTASAAHRLDDVLAAEEPLEIRVAQGTGYKTVSVTMRTPGQDRELAAGFLFTEGIIRHCAYVNSVDTSVFDENIVVVKLSDSYAPDLSSLDRNFYTTSSCGVCGKTSIEAIRTAVPFSPSNILKTIDYQTILTLSSRFAGNQHAFESTGGLHASALFDSSGILLEIREDVGRHNALDKLIGAAFLADRLPLSDNLLLLSGRISFELVQKAAMAGIGLVAGLGAPSSLAVALAEEHNMTLIGFLKSDRFNIYSGHNRISLP